MLIVNIDLQDRLTHGQTGINSLIEFAQVSACKVYSVGNMDNMAKVFIGNVTLAGAILELRQHPVHKKKDIY